MSTKQARIPITAHMVGGSRRSWRVLRRLLASYRAGNQTPEASADAGLSRRVVDTWLQRGRDGIEPYTRILAAVERQQGRAVSESLRAVNATRDSDNSDSWRAAAWLLSHGTARDRYGDRAESSEVLTVSGLFAALTAVTDPVRLGSAAAGAAVESLPLLTEHARGGDAERGEERARRGGWEEEEEGRSKQQ